MMNMHKPVHPGELFTSWLDDLCVSVSVSVSVSVPSILAVTAAG
jgi:hypothetical protein